MKIILGIILFILIIHQISKILYAKELTKELELAEEIREKIENEEDLRELIDFLPILKKFNDSFIKLESLKFNLETLLLLKSKIDKKLKE